MPGTLFGRTRQRRAFTLIELLVVIAIIALLIGILLPAIGQARKTAWAVVASANARSVVQGAAIYNVDSKGYFPPCYVYASNKDGYEWSEDLQRESHPLPRNGYIHWSYALFNNGEVPDNAFETPAVLSRGAPRTNPGPDFELWESDQINALGSQYSDDPSQPMDRQVGRLAFAANAAIMPRNKFNTNDRRQAKLVREFQLVRPSQEILITEFKETANWRSLSDPIDDNLSVIKSHRPVTPFFGLSAGADVFNEIDRGVPSFAYPDADELEEVLGTLDSSQIGLIVGQGGSNSSLEAVGDHHNGKVNFAYADGHVELDLLINTIRDRKWGDRFYSITGNNKIDEDGQPGRP